VSAADEVAALTAENHELRAQLARQESLAGQIDERFGRGPAELSDATLAGLAIDRALQMGEFTPVQPERKGPIMSKEMFERLPSMMVDHPIWGERRNPEFGSMIDALLEKSLEAHREHLEARSAAFTEGFMAELAARAEEDAELSASRPESLPWEGNTGRGVIPVMPS
jgi:hypothetical protein